MLYSFKNRLDAGKQLAGALQEYANDDKAVVLGLPRGGVPVAFEVSSTLNLPLDILLVRKLGAPGHRELALGAITLDGIKIINKELLQKLGVSAAEFDRIVTKEEAELFRRNHLYRTPYFNKQPFPAIKNHIVLIVDDGLATGATMKAAIAVVKEAKASKIIVAVPVGAASVCRELKQLVDKLICLYKPDPFYAVSQGYGDFTQTSDTEVQTLLAQAKHQTISLLDHE